MSLPKLVHVDSAMAQLCCSPSELVVMLRDGILSRPGRLPDSRVAWTQGDIDAALIKRAHFGTVDQALSYVRDVVWPDMPSIRLVALIPDSVPDDKFLYFNALQDGAWVRVANLLWPQWHVMERRSAGESDLRLNNDCASINSVGPN